MELIYTIMAIVGMSRSPEGVWRTLAREAEPALFLQVLSNS